MSIVAHELTGIEAAAIVADLDAAGIPVVVRIQDHIAHLYPQRDFTTIEEVATLRAVGAMTDGFAWHKTAELAARGGEQR